MNLKKTELQVKRTGDQVTIVGPSGHEFPFQCLDEEGKRPNRIERCIYQEICVSGAIGLYVPTCNRWRRKYSKRPDKNQQWLIRPSDDHFQFTADKKKEPYP